LLEIAKKQGRTAGFTQLKKLRATEPARAVFDDPKNSVWRVIEEDLLPLRMVIEGVMSGASQKDAMERVSEALTVMQDHGERNDQAGYRRSIRDARPYVFSPYAGPKAPDPFIETAKKCSTNKDDRINGILSLVEEKPKGRNFTIMDACAAHVAGAKKSANAKKVFLHGFMQFPTDFKITDRNQRLMLAIAVDFVNQTYGGNAVFHARIDRDEKGRHGVDVFFAPRYEKHTASKGTEQWISLSKFSKENARKRYGKRQKEVKNKKTNKFEPVFGANRKPVMVWNDADVFQGRALQDAWFEHLKAHVGGKYEIERGRPKKGRDPGAKSIKMPIRMLVVSKASWAFELQLQLPFRQGYGYGCGVALEIRVRRNLKAI
jgi:hypothetical protein